MESEEILVQQANRRLGTVLCGKYTVDRVLGVGGMAVVYAATHRNQKRVAIKMLHPELSLHAEVRKRFLREGYVANSVKHKGAVDVIDDDVDESGAAFIVMEYLEGAPLDAIAEQRGGRLDPAAAVVVTYELCAVLAAAHDGGIVHRDIKPANIFITTEGELKVLDFGIARLRDSSSGQATNTGMMLGTPAFMAPEQARGQTNDIGAATDIWAAGATLFNLLSGANVHDADTAQMIMIKAATTPARPIASVLPGVPPAVGSVVDKALQFDKGHRWESAARMRAALREAHVAVFGEPSSAQTLARLVGGSAAGGSVRPPAPSKSALGAAETVMDSPAPAETPPVRQAGSAVPGGTTAAPVTTSFVTPIASKKAVGIGIAIVACLGVGAVLLTQLGRGTSPSTSGSALIQTTTATATATAADVPAAKTTSAPMATVGAAVSPSPPPAPPPPSSASASIARSRKPADPKPNAPAPVSSPPASGVPPPTTSPPPAVVPPNDPGSVR
jgi:serine/threonine protein kinase